jgi:hypothetical protein
MEKENKMKKGKVFFASILVTVSIGAFADGALTITGLSNSNCVACNEHGCVVF